MATAKPLAFAFPTCPAAMALAARMKLPWPMPCPQPASGFTAEFERDTEGRLVLKGRLRQDAAGPWWFRTVTGTTPDGRRALIIWRKLTGNPEQDNLVLDTWFTRAGYSAKDSEFGLIYVNGDNNLENLKAADDTWKVRLIEEDFHRLMFDTEGL
jgi:adenine-specific DNA-methyltransferase